MRQETEILIRSKRLKAEQLKDYRSANNGRLRLLFLDDLPEIIKCETNCLEREIYLKDKEIKDLEERLSDSRKLITEASEVMNEFKDAMKNLRKLKA